MKNKYLNILIIIIIFLIPIAFMPYTQLGTHELTPADSLAIIEADQKSIITDFSDQIKAGAWNVMDL